ncbi:ribonuclease H [Trifolium pratense]|uniref:Ribonuclease H n=1 Tax=Trifolium pratense TaxID=57577 RepID=A0A2K3NT25_TRIPR|nr:ribonuclease H [Trifolium pratense]
MFADDLLLFGKATTDNMKAITDTLDKFCSLSGQMVSLEKTSVLFSRNVPQAMRTSLLHQSGFNETMSLGKYLGIPLIGRAPRRGDFEQLVEKVKVKLSSWKATNLSFAGRVTLAKSVIQAIPIYTMMTIPIPKSILHDIQRIQRNFIWGHEEGTKKFHMIKWDNLTLPRFGGGLSIRNLSTMNNACLMKMSWELKQHNDSLWCKVLQGKYGRGQLEEGNVIAKVSDSFIWKGVVSAWNNITRFEEWSLGDGKSINVWNDKWLGDQIVLATDMGNIPESIRNWTVADLVDDAGQWKMDSFSELVGHDIVQKIMAIPPPMVEDGDDVRVWPGDKRGRFTVSSAYSMLQGHHNLLFDSLWRSIWKLDAPERIRCFVWQLMYGRLPTNSACSRWGHTVPQCDYCVGIEETMIHVMRDCPVAHEIWNNLVPLQGRLAFFTCNYQNWVVINMEVTVKTIEGVEWRVVWATACYYIWRWRNKFKFDSNFVRPLHPHKEIMNYVDCYNKAKPVVDVVSASSRRRIDIRWRAPQRDCICLNTDGALLGGVAGCGGAFRDSNGAWKGGFAKNIGSASAYVAELWGVYEGLCLARRKSFNNIELQVDSLVVVRGIKGEEVGSASGRILLNRIRQLMNMDWNVRISHVYREANKVADAIAALGCTTQGFSYFNTPPANLERLCLDDVMGVSTPRIITL